MVGGCWAWDLQGGGFGMIRRRQEGALWALGEVSWGSELGAEVLRREGTCLVGRGSKRSLWLEQRAGVGAGRMGRVGFLM